jgi:hypothetical protein
VGQTEGAQAWLRFNVAVVPGCTSAAPKFKFQAKIDGGKVSDVDLHFLPDGIPKDAQLWPGIMLKVWMKKYEGHIEGEKEVKTAGLRRKEEEALRVQQAPQPDQQHTPQPQTGTETDLSVLNTKAKVPAKDLELEKTLFDPDTLISEEKMKAVAKYVSGRLGLKPLLPVSVLERMRAYQSLTGLRLFRAPHWSVWLKQSGQYPLHASVTDDEGSVVPQATDQSLVDLTTTPERFIGADGEEDLGFPETRVEPTEELVRQLRLLDRLYAEMCSPTCFAESMGG